MWSRLNAMKANSKRWRGDGLSSLQVHEAGPPLQSQACAESCPAPEDPVPRPRRFSEMWVRVSRSPVAPPDRMELRLPPGLGCNASGRPLRSIPAGLEQLRLLAAEAFAQDCQLPEGWAKDLSFVLIDLSLGQALTVGTGAWVVVPDSSLPALPSPGEKAKEPPAPGSEHLVQGQRLSRWIRRLPLHHRGWVVAEPGPLSERQQAFASEGRRVPLTAPVCISRAALGKTRKYRVTPGTRWCGDGGWTHVDHFEALRSKTGVPKEKLVPICISYNPKLYTYRFERSEDGCIKDHYESGTSWRHAHTIHTSTDATGERLCVGVMRAGSETRWTMLKSPRCDAHGFTHLFGFAAMSTAFEPATAPGCLLEAAGPGGQAVRRMATASQCHEVPAQGPGLAAWKPAGELLFLARRHAETDVRLCLAEGAREPAEGAGDGPKAPAQAARLHRAFRGDACHKKKLATQEPNGRKIHWVVARDTPLYAPIDATGERYCQCQVSDGEKGKKASIAAYTWSTGGCSGKWAKKEFCIQDLSVADSLRFSLLVDEVT